MRTLGRAGGVALLLIVLLAPDVLGAKPGTSGARRPPIRRAGASIDNSGRMDANNLDMFVTNHGSFGWDLSTGGSGLIFPKGSTKTALFAAGLWMGAMVNGSLRTCVAEYSQEYAPGPMKNGTYQVDNPGFRNYRINRGDNATSNPDYAAWPVGDGAPTDSLGNPALLGDAMIWSVYNDADPGRHTNSSGGRTEPLGVEIQQSTFAFNRSGALANIIFLKFKIINKGGNRLDSTYVSIWADPDLGDAADDLIGCDTLLSLGYCYNSEEDAVYGSAVPAIGFDFFRGPIVYDSLGVAVDTLGMTSLNRYTNGTDPQSALQAYNLMKGLQKDGSPLHLNNDPSQPVTRYMFPGNPVTATGWLDSGQDDRRMQLSAGPFTMAPGDTQEVVCAVIVGQGTDRLSSITDLKQKDAAAQIVFDLDFDIPSPPPNPTVWVQEKDRGIRLIWGNEPVGTHSANEDLDQDFWFEGFRVWQFASNNSQQPRLIATIDEDDSVSTIYSDLFNSAKGGFERTLVVSGSNSGLRYAIDINTDAVRGGKLINNKAYYYAVTAYAFDVRHTEPFYMGLNLVGTLTDVLESGFEIHPATPRGSNAVLTVHATQLSGDPVGHYVDVEQLIPNDLADSLYHVTFAPDESWTLTNMTSGDTVLTGQTNVWGAFDYPIVNGFMPRVVAATKPASIYQHLASGDSLDLFGAETTDSAGIYVISNRVDDSDITWFNFADGTNHDYEIRVLPDTTEYCWEYAFGDPSPQATFKCPFEIWDLGACSYQDPSDDVRVTPMIRDDDGDGGWSWGDRLYIRDIPNASVPWGTAGLVSTDVNPANDDQTLGRFGFMAADTSYTNHTVLLPPGRIRVRGGRLCENVVFEFRVLPVGSAPGTIVGNDIKKILAVPNPYYAHSTYELTQFDRVIKFTNIPASRKVTIKIYNLGGDLVRTITRAPTTADAMSRAEIVWDVNTDRNLPVASGVYIYRVDVEGVGSKTDRLAVFFEKERLDSF